MSSSDARAPRIADYPAALPSERLALSGIALASLGLGNTGGMHKWFILIELYKMLYKKISKCSHLD